MKTKAAPFIPSTDDFRLMANISHGIMYDRDLVSEKMWFNDSFYHAHSFSKDAQYDYDFWLSRVHDEDRNRIVSELRSIIAAQQDTWCGTYRFLQGNNSYVFIDDRARIIYNDDRVAVRVLGSMADISANVQLSQVSEEWEERIRLALDATEMGTWVFDPINQLVNWDSRCKQLYGFTENEIVHYDDIINHIHPSDRLEVDRAVNEALAGRKSYNIEFRVERKGEHSWRWLRCKGKAYFTKSGQVYRFAGTAQDISEEKRKDEVIAGIEKKYQSAFDNASQGIVMLDTNGRFLLVNKAFAEMTGYKLEEIYDNTFQDITHPDDVKLNSELVQKMLSGETATANFFKRYIRKDGNILWVNVHSTLTRTDDGKPESFLSIVRDISSEIENRIQQQKLLTLVENSDNLMSILEMDGRNSYLNKAGRDMLGFIDEKQVQETPISELHTPEDFQYVNDNVLPSVMNKGRWSGTMLVRHLQTKEVFPVHNSTLRIDDPLTGHPMAVGAIMRDLRPELAAQQAVLESESRFRKMIINAPVAIAILKGEQLIIEAANNPMIQVWGRTEDIIGKPLLDVLPELAGQPFPQLLREVLSTGKEYHSHDTPAYLYRDGKLSKCYFNFVYSPVRERGDEVTGVMTVAFEVTAQVEAKKALEESQSRFRDLVLNAPMPIGVYVGRDMVIQLANDEILRTWGKDSSVIGKTFREALPELEGQGFFELLHKVFDTGVAYNGREARVDLLVNGKLQTFYFNFTYKPIRDVAGEIYGIINTAADVTAFVKARQELQKTEEQLRIAIESAEMGTWTIDFNSGTVNVSDRLGKIFGILPGTHDLSVLSGVIVERDLARAARVFETALNKETSTGSYKDEYTILNKLESKEYFIRSAGKIFFDERGNVDVAIGTVQDVTVQKMTQKELEAEVQARTEELRNSNASLLRTNQELEQYAYVASHDLQEPLRKIRMFSDLLDINNDDPTVSGYLTKIRSSAARMSNLIKDLLDFSRVNKKEDLYQPTDLNAIVSNVLHDFELLIREKNAQIVVDSLPNVHAISLQMNQLFYNILGNALKFTAKAGAPRISVRSRSATAEEVSQHCRINPVRNVNYFLIQVQDNGIGFPSYLREKLFTIFQRLNGAEYEGTGIGLALCKKIVLGHGGEIWAEGDEGRGATFNILLPENPI